MEDDTAEERANCAFFMCFFQGQFQRARRETPEEGAFFFCLGVRIRFFSVNIRQKKQPHATRRHKMSFIGNLLWFIFGGGLLMGLAWLLVGCIWCITIVGVPIGIACFRIAGFAFFPFGKELVPAEWVGEKRVTGTGIMNFLWCIFSGLWLAIVHALIGIADCITIIGIPFGIANFKIAAAAFAPLGKRTVSKAVAAEARSRAAKAELDAKTAVSAIAVAVISFAATGCVSVSTTGGLLPDNHNSSATVDKKFVLKEVSRVRTIDFETQGGGRGSSTKSYDSWPEFSSAFRGLEKDSTASVEIPFDVVIRERYSVNTGAHAWTIAPWILTLGLFPAVNTDENECSIQIRLPESAEIDFSGKIIRDEWGCWFTLPWSFFPDDEETSTADILARSVRAHLTPELCEAALEMAREKRKEEERLAEIERQKMAEQRKAEAKAREEAAEIERQKELAAKKAERERRKAEAKARAEAEARARDAQ